MIEITGGGDPVSGKCGSLHCPGRGRGDRGPGGAAFLVIVLAVIGTAVAKPAARAAACVARVAVDVLQITGIVPGSAAGSRSLPAWPSS